jgi:hypothetical protein
MWDPDLSGSAQPGRLCHMVVNCEAPPVIQETR